MPTVAHPNTIDEYIAGFPRGVQRVLKRVRSTIRRAMPGASEVISYRIPAYKLQGRPVLYFAAWKEHYSLYPSTDRLASVFKKDLAPYEVTKGTIRFPMGEPVPVRLIQEIARFRAKEFGAPANEKAAPKKRR
jgi:uncharacterized protein YdhG (YjbR/CyaY superfamily)